MPTQLTPPRQEPPRVGWLWLILWTFVGLVMRLAPLYKVFNPQLPKGTELPVTSLPGAMPYGTDALYHLRRIQEVVLSYPRVPTWDTYLDFPDGALVPYEPGLDLALAWLARLIGGDDVSARLVEQIACAAIPFVGVLLIPLYTVLARQLFGPQAARLAAPLLAVLPGCVYFASAGQVDHHVLEPMIFALPFVPLLSAIKRVRLNPSHPDMANLMAITGLLLGAGFFFWRGTVLVAALLAGYLGLRALMQLWRGTIDPMGVWGGALALAVSCAVATPICGAHPMGGAGLISYFTLSWFQPLYLAGLAAGLAILGFSGRFMLALMPKQQPLQPRSRLGPWALAPAALALVPLVALAALSPSFLTAVLGGLGFLGRADSFVKSVVEQLPLFIGFDGELQLLPALSMYGLPMLYFGFGLVTLARRSAPRGGGLFWLWLLGLLVLGLMQRRYTVLLTPIYAVAIGAAISETVRAVQDDEAHPARFLPWLLGLSLVPSVGVNALAGFTEPQSEGAVEASLWLRRHTDPTHGFHLGGDTPPPQWGVVAPWGLGHHIGYLGQRPAIANPFGIEWFREGVARSARFLLSENPASTMESLSARYALVDFSMVNLRRQAPLADLNPDDYAVLDEDHVWRPGPRYWDTAVARMYLLDGLGHAPGQRPLRGVRLLYETVAQLQADEDPGLVDTPLSALKIYERVRGAQLIGAAPPGSVATVEVRVRTNLLREFVWSDEAKVGPSGTFSIQVPYATRGAPRAFTWGVDPLQVTVTKGGETLMIGHASVREQDVQLGSAVTASWPGVPGGDTPDMPADDDLPASAGGQRGGEPPADEAPAQPLGPADGVEALRPPSEAAGLDAPIPLDVAPGAPPAPTSHADDATQPPEGPVPPGAEASPGHRQP